MTVTWEGWTDVVGKLNLCYPRQQIGAETALLWFRPLADLDARDVEAAAFELLGESKWLPACAELREAALAARRSRQDAARQRAIGPPPPLGTPIPSHLREELVAIGLLKPKREDAPSRGRTEPARSDAWDDEEGRA